MENISNVFKKTKSRIIRVTKQSKFHSLHESKMGWNMRQESHEKLKLSRTNDFVSCSLE